MRSSIKVEFCENRKDPPFTRRYLFAENRLLERSSNAILDFHAHFELDSVQVHSDHGRGARLTFIGVIDTQEEGVVWIFLDSSLQHCPQLPRLVPNTLLGVSPQQLNIQHVRFLILC